MPNLTILRIAAHSRSEEEPTALSDSAAFAPSGAQRQLRLALYVLASLNTFMLSGALCLLALSYFRY